MHRQSSFSPFLQNSTYRHDEFVGVGLFSGNFDQLKLLFLRSVLVFGIDQPRFDILPDCHPEQYRFLGHETDLRSQPSYVERLEVSAIELDSSGQRVVESLNQRDYEREDHKFSSLTVWRAGTDEMDSLVLDFPDPEAPTRAVVSLDSKVVV